MGRSFGPDGGENALGRALGPLPASGGPLLRPGASPPRSGGRAPSPPPPRSGLRAPPSRPSLRPLPAPSSRPPPRHGFSAHRTLANYYLFKACFKLQLIYKIIYKTFFVKIPILTIFISGVRKTSASRSPSYLFKLWSGYSAPMDSSWCRRTCIARWQSLAFLLPVMMTFPDPKISSTVLGSWMR